MKTLKINWVVDQNLTPPSFLPPDLDITEMMDITQPGDRYRRYMAKDGKIHDGAEYFKQAQEMNRAK